MRKLAPEVKSANTDTAYLFHVVCKLPRRGDSAYEAKYSYLRVIAYSRAWRPEECTGEQTPIHFPPWRYGVRILENARSDYLPANFATWCRATGPGRRR